MATPSTQYVHCLSCGDDKLADQVLFVNIEEDAEGRDLLTFHCDCGAQKQRSLVFTK